MVNKKGPYKSTQIAALAITVPQDVLTEKLEKFTKHNGERESAKIQEPRNSKMIISQFYHNERECDWNMKKM